MCAVFIFNVCIGYDSFDAYQSSKESDHVVLCFNDNDWDGIEYIHARIPLMHRKMISILNWKKWKTLLDKDSSCNWKKFQLLMREHAFFVRRRRSRAAALGV